MMKNRGELIYERFKSIPFKPVKWPFFYGWVVIFAGIIGIIMSIPGQTIGVSVFTDALIGALEIGRVNLSTAYMIGTILSGLCIPWSGRMYDRYGVRPVILIAGILMGLTLIYLSRIADLALFTSVKLSFIDPGIIAFILITAGFFSLRFFGQGVLTMTSRNMVMKWFEQRRGFANAIVGITISFGFSYSPQVIDSVIQHSSWQDAWKLFGLVSLGFVLFAFIFFRDNPVMYGLVPDGYKKDRKKSSSPNLPLLKEYTLKEARSTYSFWIFNISLALQAMYITAFTFHIISVFEANGYDHNDAITIFLPTSVVAVAFHFFGSWLSDYMKLKYFLLLQVCGMLISMSALIFLNLSPAMRWVLIIGNGIMQGMFGVLSAVTWPRFFGVKHLGAISGYVMSWIVIGSALGPFIFSLSFRWTGQYDFAASVCIVIALVLFILALKADNVNRPEVRA
ncbi:MAG: MFS transporter [Bacteroidales bacterium]|nr:MFS transporter [Bacteroidales bacterium]